VRRELDLHPLWLDARAVLEPAGQWTAVSRAVERVAAAANEDPAAFRITNPYVVAMARR
jgi:hypothetical protein